jgi:negative regulator of sigma E activity
MRLEELERELRAERPGIDADFARKLDDWAAAGFPRGGELGSKPSGLSLRDRRARRRTQPRKRPRRNWLGTLAPAGGVAAFLVLVVALGVVSNSGDSDDADSGGGDESALEAAPPAKSVPENAATAEEAARLSLQSGDSARRELRGSSQAFNGEFNLGSRPSHGKIAQDVNLALASAPEDFRDTADSVLDVVDDHGGFILRSSVSGGDPGVEGARPGRASFDTRIPAGQLQPAIAALSDLGHVVSRTDGTKDITNRFNDAKRRIATYAEARDRLLERLEDATTETEQDAIRAQLRIVEAQLADAQDDLGNAQQRVQLVPVSVTVASAESVTRSDGEWGLGDALDDAGQVLTVAGGVLLIGVAAVLPLAILAILAWFVADRARQRARERTLDA